MLEIFSKMYKPNYRNLFVAGLFVATALVTFSATAVADPTTENVTKLKEGIVETLATWIPFVILFVLIGLALSALGINLFRKHG